jgi:hypothetical protein
MASKIMVALVRKKTAASPTPPIYDPWALSADEKQRLLAALGDGFGFSHKRRDLDEQPLPSKISPGLLQHRVYYDPFRRLDDFSEEEDAEFWQKSDGDSPPGPYEQCPVNFHLPAIREYFETQKSNYLQYALSLEKSDWLSPLSESEQREWQEYIYESSLDETYSKAWYEYHINQYIFFIDESSRSEIRGLMTIILISFAGTLGRLVEQYYWKFLIEKSAIRGTRISQSAQAGGVRLAVIRRSEHNRWKAAANLIWKEQPKLSKMAVASILKRRLGISRSPKHISRVLIRSETGANARQTHRRPV